MSKFITGMREGGGGARDRALTSFGLVGSIGARARVAEVAAARRTFAVRARHAVHPLIAPLTGGS
jgi:hypothetical protein